MTGITGILVGIAALIHPFARAGLTARSYRKKPEQADAAAARR
ncbi:hypothetical protein GCM10009859_15600 [Kocuria salsicia]